jgi:hypothetical protein
MGTKGKINRQRKSNERQARMAEVQQETQAMEIQVPMPWGKMPIGAYIKTVQGKKQEADGTDTSVALAQVVLIFGDGTAQGLILPDELAVSIANGLLNQIREVKTGLVTPNAPDIVVPMPRRTREDAPTQA